jgi:hypothetical protein
MEYEIKKRSFLALCILSNFIYPEIGLGWVPVERHRMLNNIDLDELINGDEFINRDELINRNEFRWIWNEGDLSNEDIAVLREDVFRASIDEIIDMIHWCLQAENGLSLRYILTFISYENMHEVIRRSDDQHIINILSLLERRQDWYGLPILLILSRDGRRSDIRNAAPENVQNYMSNNLWMNI